MASPELPEGDGESLVGGVIDVRHRRNDGRHRQAEDGSHVAQVDIRRGGLEIREQCSYLKCELIGGENVKCAL